MNHSTTLYTQKVSLSDLNVLAFQLREAGAKFRSTIHKQEATIVFSALPTSALSILGKSQEANTNEDTLLPEQISASTPEKCFKSDPEETTVINGFERENLHDLITLKSDEALQDIKESVEPTPEPFSNEYEVTYPLETEKKLLKLSKTKLKKLAHQYNIEGRSKLDHHQLVSALAHLVPLNKL